MFGNYLNSAIKSLFASKLYSAINIFGLAISIAACVVIALFVQDEVSYDKHWSNSDRLYRVNRTQLLDNGQRRYAGTSLILAPTLNRYFPDEIEYASRLMSLEQDVVFENQEYSESIYAVDSGLIEMFDFQIVAGNLNNVIEDMNSIALSEDFAVTIFGNNDPIGKIVSLVSTGIVGVNKDFQVDAIYRLPPKNSVLDFPALFRFDMSYFPWGTTDWGTITTQSYIQLSEDADILQLTTRLPEFTDNNVVFSETQVSLGDKPSDRIEFDLQNISEIYLNSSFDTSSEMGNRTTVIAFSAISVLVLLIGSINFMVLTTARATQRSKEVVMRKIAGARREQLIFQFLVESLFTAFLSIVIALGLLELALPLLATFTEKSLAFDYGSLVSYVSLLVLLLTVGSAGGIYPAIILSRFRPSGLLKSNQSAETVGILRMRNFLVVIQFAVSIALIIATSIIFTQMRFLGDRDPGFNKENLIVISNLLFREEVNDSKSILKEEILKLASITDAARY